MHVHTKLMNVYECAYTHNTSATKVGRRGVSWQQDDGNELYDGLFPTH